MNYTKKQRLLYLSVTLLCIALCACGTGRDSQKRKQEGWSAKQGITVTPQGDCQVEMGAYDATSGTIKDDFTANVNVHISESTENVADGYKKVSAVFVIDASNCSGDGILFWCSAFDRYTGTSFEFDSAVNQQLDGEHTSQDGFVTIRNGDETYDVSVEFMTEGEGTLITKTVVITCPVDYDGVMFQLGKDSLEQMTKNAEIDYAARLYTIDELPYYGGNYQYFTMTDD